MPGWYEGIGSTNYKGYKPAEMDAQQLINQGYSSPNVGVYGPAPRNVPSMRAPTFSGQVGFTAPGAVNSQAFGRVASADYGGASRSMGRADAATIRPNDFEAGVLARSGLQWNPAAGQAERVGVQAPMMAARPGVQAPASRSTFPEISPEEAGARRARMEQRAMQLQAQRQNAQLAFEAERAKNPRVPAVASAPRPAAPAPPAGGGGPRMGPDPRAQAVQAAMQAFAESSARYGGGGRGMVNLAGVEAGQAYDQRQLQSQQLQQANELDRQRLAIMQQEVEMKRASQIPVQAQIRLKAMELGMDPVAAEAFAVRTAGAQPGSGVLAQGGAAPNIGVPQASAPGVARDPMENEVTLINSFPPEILAAIRTNGSASMALAEMVDRGFNPSAYPADAVKALREKLVGTYGSQGISAATSSPIRSGGFPVMGGFAGANVLSLPKPLRVMVQPFNYLLGGSGTGMIGDPAEQIKRQQEQISLWKSLGG